MVKKYSDVPKHLRDLVLPIEEKERVELAKNLTIQERLLRRLNTSTIKVPFNDDIGIFNIEVRMLTPAEQNSLSVLLTDLMLLQNKLNEGNLASKKLKTIQKQSEKLFDKIYCLTEAICVDKTLNFNYWKKGEGHNLDVPLILISAAGQASRDYKSALTKFRG